MFTNTAWGLSNTTCRQFSEVNSTTLLEKGDCAVTESKRVNANKEKSRAVSIFLMLHKKYF
jgi:hypothetical protein